MTTLWTSTTFPPLSPPDSFPPPSYLTKDLIQVVLHESKGVIIVSRTQLDDLAHDKPEHSGERGHKQRISSVIKTRL